MEIKGFKKYQTHGDGSFKRKDFKSLGDNVIFEQGVLVFHPENISIGNNVYIGHNTVLKAYYKNEMIIGDHTWIGQGCFFHGAGGISIGKAAGIGPMVRILTSSHSEPQLSEPVMSGELQFKAVEINDGCDIGVGSVILPGISVGEGSIIGAGSVVTKDVPSFCIVAGVPAKFMRNRS
ncbi:MAG: acyltransferase [Candidatus Fermentibacteria bacterium]